MTKKLCYLGFSEELSLKMQYITKSKYEKFQMFKKLGKRQWNGQRYWSQWSFVNSLESYPNTPDTVEKFKILLKVNQY